MVMRNIPVKAKPLVKDLGNGFELQIIIMKTKKSNIPWRAIIVDYNELESGNLIAIFDKPLKREDYTAAVQGHEIINDNGVQATYRDWQVAVEKLTGAKISWQPMGREMFRLNM